MNFHTILDNPNRTIELDRVHRALGPRSADLSRPHDVVCRLHCYTQKDDILRTAWEHGVMELDRAQIKILPDLPRATLRR